MRGGGATKSIKGYVIDAPVKGATVSLQCDDHIAPIKGTNPRTDENGYFLIDTIPQDQNLSFCKIISRGGNDGDDLSSLELKRPYSLTDENDEIIVSPITTLVSKQMENNSTLKQSIDKVASFLGIDTNEISKDPRDDVNLAKKAKILTKIALTKDKDLFVLDFPTKINDTDLTSYIANLNTTTLENNQTRANLQSEVEIINSAKDVDDIKKQSIIATAFTMLKDIYRQDSYSDIQKANLKTLSSAIAKANVENGEYQTITKNELRKALFDVDLLPQFKIRFVTDHSSSSTTADDITGYVIGEAAYNENGEKLGTFKSYWPIIKKEDGSYLLGSDGKKVKVGMQFATNILLDEISSKLASADFNSTVKMNDINVTGIDSIIVYHADTNEKTLDTQSEKRSYYAFSDKSNIARAIALTKNSYSDDVNDPVNSDVAKGLAKLGYSDMAFDYIDDNVYSSKSKLKAYHTLGLFFVKLGNEEYAKKAFFKEYKTIKAQADALGKENVSSSAVTTLQAVVRNLSSLGAKDKADEAMAYLESFKDVFTTTNNYTKVVQAFEDLAEDAFTQSGDRALATEYINKAMQIAKGMPHENEMQFLHYAYRIAITGLYFGQDPQEMIDLAKTIDAQKYTKYTDITSRQYYGYFVVIVKALKKDIAGAFVDFGKLYVSYNNTRKDETLGLGFGAAVYVYGDDAQKAKLTEIYKDSDAINARILALETTLSPYRTFQTAYAIKALDETKFEPYLDYMVDLIDNNITLYGDSDKELIYAKWGLKDNAKQGMLGIAKMYKDLGKDIKAKNVLNVSYVKVKDFKDNAKKIKGLQNIIKASNEIGIDLEKKNDFLKTLKDAASKSTEAGIKAIIDAANVLSVNGKREDAKTLVEKAYGFVGDETDLKSVQKYVAYLIGSTSTTKPFATSIANGYFQAGDKVKAKEMIDLAFKKAQSLGDTVDTYKLYVNVVNAYGSINITKDVKDIIALIKTDKEKISALRYTASALANFDAFVKSDVASVDSDNDGRPDFWDLGATQKQIADSGLVLDDDVDGDGKLDTEDKLPYDNVD